MSYSKSMSFNDYRAANKISEVAAFMLVFKSCVGLGVFTYPYAFGKAGYLFGGIMCVLMTYMTGYGMYSLSSLASEVEKSKFGMVKMHNYYSKAAFHSMESNFSFGALLDGESISQN